ACPKRPGSRPATQRCDRAPFGRQFMVSAGWSPPCGTRRLLAELVTCSACGTENRTGRRFCGQCGAALSAKCTSCGADNEPGDRFCGECGSPLGATASEANGQTNEQAAAPIAERRLVTVMFADLVGFTSLSEHRD